MTDIIFVCDFFYDGKNFLGGAELTTEAIISFSNRPVVKIKSQDLTTKFVEENSDKQWVFGNFFFIKEDIIFQLIKSKISYDVIEYDFKFCEFRNPIVHIRETGSCNCSSEMKGKITSLFLNKARRCWFMSEKQKEIYKSNFPFLQDDKMIVLSSVFKKTTLEKLSSLNKGKNDKYIIFNSDNWLKGTQLSLEFARKNNLKYEMVSHLSYEQMLIKLSESKGLIFLPNALDTCPRITIEAKILGCELFLNDKVLHADEEWFSGSIETVCEYLSTNCDKLWSSFDE